MIEVAQASLDLHGGIIDEKWALDPVVALGGSPVVTEGGNIAYVFEVTSYL